MQKKSIARSGTCQGEVHRAGRPITVLTLQERRVVTLLRTGCCDGLAANVPHLDCAGISEELARLACNVRAAELNVFSPQSRFVSDDELAILSWLSMLQRPSQTSRWRMANPFQESLCRFAQALLRDEGRLPARSMLAEARLERLDCFQIELLPVDADRASGRHEPGRDMPGHDMQGAAARAIALVEQHRFATASQFRALGISSQKLSRLCRRGYVERVSLGLYKKPGAMDAMLAS
ncbi:MAG: type IV toxin-antitoxin system AbiEi family antitoxin domain-containing protein [Novosphingobium sp.]